MSIATRLALVVGLTVVAVSAIHTAWSIDRVLDRVDRDAGRALGAQLRVLAAGAEAVGERDGPGAIVALVDQIDADLGHRLVDWVPTTAASASGAVVSADTLVTRTPVHIDGRLAGHLTMGRSTIDIDAERRAVIIERVLAAVLLALACALVIGWSTRRLVGAPLAAIVDFTRAVGAGELDRRVVPARLDEIGDLAGEMNEMVEGIRAAGARIEGEARRRIAAQQALRHAERLKTVGQLTAGVAHELGTPLNVVMGRARLIERGRVTGDALVESAAIIRDQARRMADLVRDLLTFARRAPTDDTIVDLARLAERVERLLSPLARKAGVELVLGSAPPSAAVRGREQALEQVLANLVVNAVHAAPSTVRIELAASPGVPDDAGDPVSEPEAGATPVAGVALEVTDDGAGMSPEVVERVFEPFFTTKDVGEGTGLGLSVVYGIVRDHRGRLTVRSAPGHGTTFGVWLPAA